MNTQKVYERLQSKGIKISKREIARLAKDGAFPGSIKNGNIWNIPEDAVEEYLKDKLKGEKQKNFIWKGIALSSIIAIVSVILERISNIKDLLDLFTEYILVLPTSETIKRYFFITSIGSVIWLILLITLSFLFSKYQHYRRIIGLGIIFLLIFAMCILGFPQSRRVVMIGLGVPPSRASSGETLILIAEFEDKSAGKASGFDLPGRIYREITDRIGEDNSLFPVQYYRSPIKTIGEARIIERDLGATVLIWGSFDAVGGRLNIDINSQLVSPLVCKTKDFKYQSDNFTDLQLTFTRDLPDFSSYVSLLSLGVIQYQKEDNNKAIELLSDAINIAYNTNNIRLVDSLFYRAAAYSKVKKYNDALGDLNRIEPKDATIYYGIGTLYIELMNYDMAIDNSNKAINKETTYCALDHRAFAHTQKGDYSSAISDYTNATALYPFQASAYCHLGVAYYKNKQYTEAISSLRKGLDLYKNYADKDEEDAATCQSNLDTVLNSLGK